MPKASKTNAMRFLEAHALDYRWKTYECHAFIDGITVAQLAGVPAAQTFKTLVTVSRPHHHFAFAIPVACALDFKKAARAVGEKSIALLPVKEINAVTGYDRGGCTLVGMKRQLPTVIDRRALGFETIFLSGGRLGTQIEIDPRALAQAIGAHFEDVVADSLATP